MNEIGNASGPKLIGHRGVTGRDVQENTLDAFAEALESGCHGIETDLRRTSDGHLILLHDRTLPGGAPVAQSSLKQCHEALGFEPPLLEEAIDAFPTCIWNLEIKTPDVLNEILTLRRATERLEDVYISSFDHNLLTHLKRLVSCPAFALTATLPRNKEGFLHYLGDCGFDGVVWDFEIVRDDYILHMNENGILSACYGLENREEIRKCKSLGITYAIIDSVDVNN